MVPHLIKRIVDVAYRDGMGHIPSALSILDIVHALHSSVMKEDDQFILSKGHGCMALYAVLEDKGLLDWSSRLQGHPLRGGPIIASTGSLGHGLPMAVGLALAKKIKGESGRVFCLVGDGECNEGTTWEAALIAAHQKLDNLTVIIDENGSSERALSVGELSEKFIAFGFDATIENGHRARMPFLDVITSWPRAVICRTIKGHGVPFMENNPEWHNKKLTKEDYEKAIS